MSTADASGDLHAAALIRALRARLPELHAFGLGGADMEAAGFDAVVRQSDLAVAGLVEVLGSAPRFVRSYLALRRSLSGAADGVRPDVCVLVDSPDLNLPLAAVARRAGIPVVYYVAPQTWAWRSGRVRKLRRRVDHLVLILPFEEALFRAQGVPATFVGHPHVEKMASVRADLRAEEVAQRVGLDLDRPSVGLLPGSRSNEFTANLPIMLETARLLHRADSNLQFRLLLAPTQLQRSLELPDYVGVVRSDVHAVMAISTCLLTAPGTVTVEAALLGVPSVVVHRVNRLTFELVRRVVHVPSTCMVNLVAGRGVLPERIQRYARPPALAALLAHLLGNPAAREHMRADLASAVSRLGEPGAAERAAEVVLRVSRGEPVPVSSSGAAPERSADVAASDG